METNRTCTIHLATSGVCGKPAVRVVSDQFAECAEHDGGPVVGVGLAAVFSPVLVGDTVTVTHAGKDKTGTVVSVAGRNVRVRVPLAHGGHKVISRYTTNLGTVR